MVQHKHLKFELSTFRFNLLIMLFNFYRPSSSKAENIRLIYYEAEYNGKQQQCQQYFDDCNIGLLDLASNLISIEARKIM